MDFRYSDYFQAPSSTGYETLLYDVMMGDATLFQRADMVEAGWGVVQPMLDLWATGAAPVHEYSAGSHGPGAADRLLDRDGRHWLPLP
jgi:glucose-6-phosphate 1-dehydrogenase